MITSQYLAAEFLAGNPNAVGDAGRVKDVIFYSGATVERMDWMSGDIYNLTFSMDPKHVDLSRLNSGAPLLRDHMPMIDCTVGVIEKAWLEGSQGKASVRFSDNPSVDEIWNNVEDGIIRSVSMGVIINDFQDISKKGDQTKSYLAVDWQPREISLVAIPADANAQFLGGLTLAQIAEFKASKRVSEPGAASPISGDWMRLQLHIRGIK